jgi:glutaredoxin
MGKKEKERKGVGEITIYTLSYCQHCQTLKGALDNLKVPYTDVDIDVNPLMGDWLEDNLKTESFPIIYFKKREGEYIYILSETNLETLNGVRIFNTIDEALEILLQYYYEI